MIFETRELFRKYTDSDTFDRIVEYPTVVEMWRRCAADYADLIAVRDDNHDITYREMDSHMAGLRGKLRDLGLNPKDRVALLAPNGYECALAIMSVVTAGMTAIILPPQLPEQAVTGLCMMTGVKAIVYGETMAEKVKAPVLKLPITLESGDCPMADCAASDGCLVMFTGGTTGKSKAVALNHGAVMQGVVNGCYGYKDVFNRRYLLVLPLSHVFGLIRNMLSALYTGSELCICSNAQNMFRDIGKYRPTILVLVPALAEMALKLCKQFKRNMLGDDLQYVICGAAAVAPYLVREYAARGIALFPGYGLTETANLVSGNPESSAKPDSVGIPYPHQEIRLVDGELWVRGANLMDGYLGPDNGLSDGWLHTGDLATFDEDGYLYITGRTKELIILSNGENVSPAEVEAIFNRCDLIQDSQLFEDIGAGGNHILALEVVPRTTEVAKLEVEDKQAYLMSELQKINETLPAYQRAARIEIRDTDFERTPSMKILRYKKCN